MKLEHYPVAKLKQQILEIARKYLDIDRYHLFFFGSRINGQGSERSDIDIGIEGTGPIEDKTFFALKEEINKLPTLYKFDLVDFQKASDAFRQVALKNIEDIHRPGMKRSPVQKRSATQKEK